MATSTKPIYALRHIPARGRIILPGERVDEHLPDYAVTSLLAHGEATEDANVAKQAAIAEGIRLEDVALRQETRSEKREHNSRT